MNITAKELSGVHVGKTITVILDGLYLQTERYTGTLHALSHESETERVGNEYYTARIDTRNYVDITLGIARIKGIPHNTPITIQEGE